MPWAMSLHKINSWSTWIVSLAFSTNTVSDSAKSSVIIMGTPSTDESTTSKNCSTLGWDKFPAQELHILANWFLSSDMGAFVILGYCDKLCCVLLCQHKDYFCKLLDVLLRIHAANCKLSTFSWVMNLQ